LWMDSPLYATCMVGRKNALSDSVGRRNLSSVCRRIVPAGDWRRQDLERVEAVGVEPTPLGLERPLGANRPHELRGRCARLDSNQRQTGLTKAPLYPH
jgi:hypothetical protein